MVGATVLNEPSIGAPGGLGTPAVDGEVTGVALFDGEVDDPGTFDVLDDGVPAIGCGVGTGVGGTGVGLGVGAFVEPLGAGGTGVGIGCR